MTSVAIIGSTGSIGRSALAVIEKHLPEIQVTALAAGTNIALLADQIEKHKPAIVSVADEAAAKKLRGTLGAACPEILIGADALRTIAKLDGADIILVSVSGALGLWPAWEAARSGKRLALATKEALVLLGGLLMSEAKKSGAEIIPVDSEHSALFQLLRGTTHSEIKSLWLSASGGPFRGKNISDLEKAAPEDALAHPVWKMGAKVTIDSATLMNKGLEIIEARWLFDTPAESIKVVVHPQGIIHAMVELIDGTILMHAGMPDMKAPIAYAFSYPDRAPAVLPPLDLAKIKSLVFEEPDDKKFPCLALARRALEMGGTAPAAMNAADEIAVQAFLDRRISFPMIGKIIASVLDIHDPKPVACPEDALEADRLARKKALEILK